MNNETVALFFDKIADILEIKNDNIFKIRAYRRAAQNIRSLTEDISVLAEKGALEEIPGIGKEIADKTVEILKTGRLKAYEKLKKSVPHGILDLLAVPGIGPKKARLLHDKLKIRSVEGLEKKAELHRIRGLPGFKDKSEDNILRGIEIVKKRAERMTLKEALDLSNEIISQLKKVPAVRRITTAGSLRRMKETVRDIDILITSARPGDVMGLFVKLPIVKSVLAHGRTKSSILSKSGVQVDLRVVDEDSFGAALVYLTGSQAHNIHIRHMAKKMGLKVNEYGVFDERTGKIKAAGEEVDVYRALKLEYIPPELREDRGEIEAAGEGKLPCLVEVGDIKGDLHVHSEWSDGAQSIEEMARGAIRMGYEYIAITDHSRTLKIAGGLSEKDVLRKNDEIRKLNKRLKGIRILTGVEIDILKDGALDYSKDFLKNFDIVVAAIHSGFKESKELLTRRITKAMETGKVHILSHPTGRLMGTRGPYELDFDRIFKAAKATGTCLEINAFPERLDLDDINSKAAKDAGIRIAIGTDAHILSQLEFMHLGVSVARRAWLESKDVLNTLNLAAMLKSIRK